VNVSNGITDQHVRAHAVRGAGETGFQQTACRRLQRLERIAGIVSEEHRRTWPQAREQPDLKILQRRRIQAAREFDAAFLSAQVVRLTLNRSIEPSSDACERRFRI
jgi:hypothetical protein